MGIRNGGEIAGHGTRKEMHGEGGKQVHGQHAATAVSASEQPEQQAGEHQSWKLTEH